MILVGPLLMKKEEEEGEDRKKDEKLRHPTDGKQWRKIERDLPEFAGEARNLWFGLSTDGMNPFREQSCSHST